MTDAVAAVNPKFAQIIQSPETNRRVFDYCVIGGGASGLMAATELASAGKSVLTLEEGSRAALGSHLRTAAEQSWKRALAPGDPKLHANPWTARFLGGGTMFFAGIAFRYRELDFTAGPFLAADALYPNWPITYPDLWTSYDEVERRLGVARSGSADLWQPPAAPAPLPPHDYDDRGRLIAGVGIRLGLRPFSTALAVNSRPYAGSPACMACSSCTEYLCPIGAKGDAVRRILESSHLDVDLTIRTGARVRRAKQASSTE